MGKSSRLRWAILTAAFASTIGAIFYPVDNVDDGIAHAAPVRERQATVIEAAESRSAHPVDKWVANDDDPFAPRLWQAPEPEPELARAIVPAPPAEELPVVQPTLPYAFVGQMVDGGNRVVYLSRGEQLILARSGAVLEGTYKVLQISESQVEFEILASGLRQVLPIPVQN